MKHTDHTAPLPEYAACRPLTAAEIAALEARGNRADDWSSVRVAANFSPDRIEESRFEGTVLLGAGVTIRRATLCNYRIGDGVRIEGVVRLECRGESAFGNGVRVAAMNECGGRPVALCDRLTAQTAYVLAVYRHRPETIARIEALVDARARELTDTLGTVGEGSTLVAARLIREVRIGRGVTVEGASLLENGTLCDGARIGADVKARDFIVAEEACVDNGATLERCFVGECVRLDKGFAASESLFFANSHCENGEAASVFAGPCTVSHHKSSLLIAGMFSFFNAGSGTNQSNHLFKSGAVHQSVHQRGCKFASGAYVMSPAVEAPFTLILGRHANHHDTKHFPYSYLIEQEGRSMLMPGANLTSCGTVRDLAKWPQRDRRRVQRDVINYEAWNPFVAQLFVDALRELGALAAADPEADTYTCNRVFIRAAMLRRGLKHYERALAASLGAMLERGECLAECDGTGRWIDVAGQFMTRRAMDDLLARVDAGGVTALAQLNAAFRHFHARYDAFAHRWALAALAAQLGHDPSADEVAGAIAAGREAREAFRRAAEADLERDAAPAMSVSYGLDAEDPSEVEADFRQVRNL